MIISSLRTLRRDLISKVMLLIDTNDTVTSMMSCDSIFYVWLPVCVVLKNTVNKLLTVQYAWWWWSWNGFCCETVFIVVVNKNKNHWIWSDLLSLPYCKLAVSAIIMATEGTIFDCKVNYTEMTEVCYIARIARSGQSCQTHLSYRIVHTICCMYLYI